MKTLRISLALVPLLLAASVASADPTLTSGDLKPVLWGAAAASSDWLEYSVGVTSTGSPVDQKFLNVVGSDGSWLVQNMPVGYEPGSAQMATLIPSSLYNPLATYQKTLTSSPAASQPGFTAGAPLAVGAATNYLKNDTSGGGPDTTVDPAISTPPAGINATVGYNFGNVLGFSWHFGMPDIAQGPDECYPTSAANSLKWLNPGLNLTTEQIRDQLITDMKTNNGHSGTYNKDFIPGKDAFMARHGLQIETHEITLADILTEMNKGQDVELVITPKGKNWGHMVTLVGAFATPFGTGFAVSDPDDGTAGQISTFWADANGQISRGTYSGWELKWAWAESPVPEPGTLALLGLGAATLIRRRTRKTCNA